MRVAGGSLGQGHSFGLGREPLRQCRADQRDAGAISMVTEVPRLVMDYGSKKVPRAAPIRPTAAAKPVPIARISVAKTSPG